MTQLSEILDVDLLARRIAEGYVRRQVHPTLPLEILNYSNDCQWDRAWDAVTRQTRGLVVNSETGAVVARPMPKMHNYGEPDAPQDLSPEEHVIATDKMDGSLGILVPDDDEHAPGLIATRGSFTSEQALHATQVWKNRYAQSVPEVPEGMTLLFEIIFPDNRIVLDYGEMDDLVLLGAVEIATGESIDPDAIARDWWPGPVVSRMSCATLEQALAAEPRPNAEGMVLHLFERGETRLKLKQSDYVELHKLVTGLNTKTVWEHIAFPPHGAGRRAAELAKELPDEFAEWVLQTADGMEFAAYKWFVDAERAYNGIVAQLPEDFSRKDFALIAKQHELAPALFKLLDGGDIWPWAWRQVKPSAEKAAPMARAQGEDVA